MRSAPCRRIAALQPRIVVSGHKPTVEGIVSAMLELHPDRDNPRVVWHSAREAVKKRQEA
jgi:hypothetical protein